MPINGIFLTIDEVAERLNLSPSRVGRFCREGRFKNARKFNKIWLIPPDDLKKLVRLPRGAQKKERISEFMRFKQQYLAQSASQALENS